MATPTVDDQSVRLRVPPSIAQDYERRSVFPELRITDVFVEGAVTYRVAPNLAAAVLADAREQHRRKYTRDDRGTKKSFGHLIEVLREALEPEAVEEERRHRREEYERAVTSLVPPEMRVALPTVISSRLPSSCDLKRQPSEPAVLEVKRYGDKLMNAFGSSRQLIAAGFLPSDFEFPPLDRDGEDGYPCKKWQVADVRYEVGHRYVSAAQAAEKARTDHWWFQVLDSSKRYPDDFVAIYRAELEEARRHGR